MMVRTPGLGKHFFFSVVLAGVQRFYYQIPNLQLPYMEDYNGNGKLQQIIFPSENRKIIYRYNHFGQPTLMLFGDSEIVYGYDANIAMMSSAEVIARGHRVQESFTYDSSLVSSYGIHFPDDYRLLNAKFAYVYDKNFRLVAVDGIFSRNLSTSMNYSYNDNNGFLSSIKYLTVQWPLVNREKIFDEHVIISRELDLYGRAKNVEYAFRDTVRFKMSIVYDEMNRIQSWTRVIGQTDTSSLEYRYGKDGNLLEVFEDDVSKWRFGYDNNGNIDRVEKVDNNFDMEYDAGDKIKTFGKYRYKFDQDGFMIQRHDEDLLFNSVGQLVSITNSGLFKYTFYYDHQNRLIIQSDRVGNIMQYFYADTLNLDLVTHTYNHSNQELTQYFYDSKGKLVAYERQSKFHYVATDPMGSPVVLFDESGMIVKQMSYDPFGQVVSDSNPNYEFSFGFQGLLYNPVTRLVHMGKRVYDTMIGRYLNPDYSDMMKNLRYLTEDPIMMNNYRFRQLVNKHLTERTFPTLGKIFLILCAILVPFLSFELPFPFCILFLTPSL